MRSLLLYSCSIIVVCLNIFNLYLFAWVWSSLSGSGSSPTHSLQWAKIDFVSSMGLIKFSGKLTSKRTLKMSNLQVLQEPSETTSELLRIYSNRSIDFATAHSQLLRLDTNRIAFPAGLKVTVGNENLQSAQLVCPINKTQCRLEAPRFRFTSAQGLDFRKLSLQSSKIAVQRIHSATHQVSLLAHKASKFESGRQSVRLRALDSVSLFSMKSFVSAQYLARPLHAAHH